MEKIQMRLESVSLAGYITKRTKPQSDAIENRKTGLDYQNHCGNVISDFPKSYVKISPAFKASFEEEDNLAKAIKDQQRINDYLWAKSWDKARAREEYDKKIDYETERRKEEAFAYLKRSTKQAIKDKYNRRFNNEEALYNDTMKSENVEYCEKLLKNSVKTRVKSSSEILRNTKGTIDSKIAGYSSLKDDMKDVFILPVTQELLDGGEKKVKNGILLCGPTGCGKTIAAEAIANETYCYVDRIKTDTEPRMFERVLSDKLKEAQRRYRDKQQELEKIRKSDGFLRMAEEERDKYLKSTGSPRTVIIIDEFDRYFNPISVDPETIKKNINAVKTMFDGCAEFPRPENANASAVTFICTTNYPKRIPVGEDINLNKLTPYAVLPPAGEDMEEVLRHYMKLGNAIMQGHKKNGNTKLVEIDYKNMNLKKFVQRFGPSEKDGAFSNDAICWFVTKAVEAYIDKPEFDFNLYILREFKYGLRDIRPEKLKRYQMDLDKLGLLGSVKVEKIDYDNSSRREIVEKKIKNLTIVPEEFLTAKQLDELYALRAELESLNNN